MFPPLTTDSSAKRKSAEDFPSARVSTKVRRVLLRLEFLVAHPILNKLLMLNSTLANDQKWPFKSLKWWIFSQTSSEQSGKNRKSWFFLLGLKYTLRTFFESKKLLSKSCPELSNQVHVLKVYFKPSRKNPDFGFLPLPSKLVWLKNSYLSKNKFKNKIRSNTILKLLLLMHGS